VSAIPVLLPVGLLLAGIVAAFVGLWHATVARVVAVAAVAAALVVAIVGSVHVLDAGPISHHLGGWPPPIGIEYVLDPLSGAMAILVCSVGLLVLVYPPIAGYYERTRRGAPIHALTLLLLTGLLGVLMSGDLFNLYVFLEVYAIATYALVALGGDRAAFAAFRYLILATVASGFYLLGVGFIYFTTGTLNMADVAARLPGLGGSPTIVTAAVLIAAGLAVKMALFPFHVWLPGAHSFAPPAVAALLAAIQVKISAYALIRILLDVFRPEYVAGDLPLMTLLAWFGAAGIVFGSVQAIRQTDFKRLLAYSTVAQLGYVGVGIGLATPLALVAALLHILAHALAKCCLFFVAGGIIDRTGVKDVTSFAGLSRRMPWTMAGFAIAVASMVGIPPTAGFFSKWYLVWGSVEAENWAIAIVIVGSSLLTLVYFLRVFERVYMATEVDPAVESATEASAGVLGPTGALAIGVLVVGLANAVLVAAVLDPIATGVFGAG
jgi:multicomponent Na+:H+ antiporter subunit D